MDVGMFDARMRIMKSVSLLELAVGCCRAGTKAMSLITIFFMNVGSHAQTSQH